MATNDTSAQIKVLNVASSSLPVPAVGGTYTSGNNSAATAIAVDHSTVLAAIGTTLYKLSVDANGALAYVAQTPLSGVASKIVFYGDGKYAYVGTASNNQQVQVISYASGLSVKNSINLGSSGDANGLWLKGNWLLVGTTGGAGSDNFLVYDVSGPNAPSSVSGIPTTTLASLNLGSRVTSVVASTDENFAFAGVNINGQEMKTIDLGGLLSTSSKPFIAASSTETTLNGFINDMYFSRDSNTIFIADQNNTEGGYIFGEIPGFAGFNTQYAVNGTYTEFPLTDAGQNVNWNTISWKYSTSTGCGDPSVSGFIKMQVRSGLTSDLSAIAFEGPDGNSSSSYMLESTGSFIYAPDNTGTRYIQYQATLVSDTSCTPFLTNVTFNYTK